MHSGPPRRLRAASRRRADACTRAQVHVCGSFTNWLTPIPMAPDGTGGGAVFAVVCNLPPGCAAALPLPRAGAAA